MVVITYVNAVGGTIISGLTIVSAGFLFVKLLKQGRGKLRVRLLVGMVVSDVILGIVFFPSELAYLTGHPITTGTAICNAQGIILTAVLFTQHLWTVVIAVATFLLLKHPLSNATTILERYSWACWPLIWGISFIHSGIWHALAGWTSSGNLCYYAQTPLNGGTVDARDLVQFVPRALVFLIILILYSRLFSFLRRPDTIHLSTQNVSGFNTPNDKDSVPEEQGTRKILGPLVRLGRLGSTSRSEPTDPAAPWEKLEFVTVNHRHITSYNPTASFSQTASITGILTNPYPSVNVSPKQDDVEQGLSKFPMESPIRISEEGDNHQELRYDIQRSHENRVSIRSSLPQPFSPLTPVLSHGCPSDTESPSFVSEDAKGNESDDIMEDRTPSGQTMKEFFQEHPGPSDGLENGRGRGSTTGIKMKDGLPISATAYFNRQASLLMLYFPLAYMIVFSVSLIRLVYDMVNTETAPVLSLISNWFVLSVGLIDAAVFGLAEFMVRRRVRRKMPDRM